VGKEPIPERRQFYVAERMDTIQKNGHWRQQKLMLGLYVTLNRLQTVVTKRESL